MINRKGDQYAGNWLAPPRAPGLLRKVVDTVVVYLTVTALLAALALFVFWTTSKSAADDYRDGYPDRNDVPHQR